MKTLVRMHRFLSGVSTGITLSVGAVCLLGGASVRADEPFSIILPPPGSIAPATPPIPVGAFAVVSPGIFRGARPDAVGLRALAQLGVRTDLDLEDIMPAVAAEQSVAQSLGMRFFSFPMSGFWAPHDAEVAQILQILADPRNYPIFVHCEHGHDRTGLIVGLFRVFFEHRAPADAYREMRQLGFHPQLYPLKRYFDLKTGYRD